MSGAFAGRFCVVVVTACACQGVLPHEPRQRNQTRADDGFVTVDVSVSGRGEVEAEDFAGWCKRQCSYRVAKGTRIRFRAESHEDFFSGWTGPCGFGSECAFAPSGNVKLRAHFERDRREFQWARVLSADDCIGVDALIARRELVLLGHLRENAELDGHKLTGAGKNDVLVSALDPDSGRTRWARLIGGPNGDGPGLLGVAAAGDLVVSIWTPSVKSGPGKSINWISSQNGAVTRSAPIADLLHNMQMLPNEDLIGISSPGMFRGPSKVTRADVKGNVRWSTTLEATKELFVDELAIDGPETIIVGSLKGDPRFGGQSWMGSRRPGSFRDYFLARMHLTDGQLLESRWLFSGERFEDIAGLAVEGRNLLFALNTMGATTFLGQELQGSHSSLWIISASSDLDHINWVQRFRTDRPMWDVNIRAFRGGFVVAGRGNGSVEIGSRTIGGVNSKGTMFVAELQRDGRVVWADGMDTGGGYRAPAVAIDQSGNFFVSGPVKTRTTMGTHALQPSGGGSCDTIYLAKIRRRP